MRPLTHKARHRARTLITFLMAFLLLAPLAMSAAVPAHAQEPEILDISKTVETSHEGNRVEAGEPFKYTVKTECSQEACINAEIVDSFPAELDGFTLSNVTGAPADYLDNAIITWFEGGEPLPGQPETMGPATEFKIVFQEDVGTGKGLPRGEDGSVVFTIQTPDTLEPGEFTATNTATSKADNAAEDTASVDIVLSAEEHIGVEPGKSWTPENDVNTAGTKSTIELSARNTSNISVDELTIREPASTDAASDLDANNPFRIADLASLDFSNAPEGTDSTTLWLYLKSGDEWGWQEFSDATGLPAEVDPADVGGFEVSYVGTFAPGAEAGVTADVELRATDRNSGEPLGGRSITVENTASATAAVDGHEPRTEEASARYSVNPVELGVNAQKSIAPDRIGSGETTSSTLTVQNTSPIGVNSLTVSDRDFFDDLIEFGGFESITFPEGAESAVAKFYMDGQEGPAEVSFGPGETPAAPANGVITGFDIVFTGDKDSIKAAATAEVKFSIDTNEDSHGADYTNLERTNTVTGIVEPTLGDPVEDQSSKGLTVIPPAIETTLDKTVHPNVPVRPGHTAVTELKSTTDVSSSYVKATNITITDAATGQDNDFWEAFDLEAISSVQIPSGTSGTIRVQTAEGQWTDIESLGEESEAWIYSRSASELAGLLSEKGLAPGDVTGIEFDFTNTDGFAQNVTITPYVAFTARSDLRGGGDIDGEKQFVNSAVVAGTGEYPGGEVNDGDRDDDTGGVAPLPGDSQGVGIDKRWTQNTVTAQSGQNRDTRITWNIDDGFGTVAITDVPEPTENGLSTVYDAFDLVRLHSINYSDTPYSNGWYLRYDSVESVQLHIGGEWETITPPSGGWMSADGFVGYDLSAEERQSATGVRYILKPNDEARAAAQGQDPFAPEEGAGIAASSSTERFFSQRWQIRDTLRSAPTELVTHAREYNVSDSPGDVRNDAGIEATPIGGGDPAADSSSDTITIEAANPGIKAAKQSANEELFVPKQGSRPTTSFTITAHSDSVAKATHLLLTDPPVCGDGAAASDCVIDVPMDGNPLGEVEDLLAAEMHNPFDEFNLTGISITQSVDEADFDASTVWLTRRAGSGAITSTEHSVNEAVALSAEQLADVIGVAALFTTSDYVTAGGAITQQNRFEMKLDVEVRDTYRVSGEPLGFLANDKQTVRNRVGAQAFDLNLLPDARNFAQGSASVVLQGGTLDVSSEKSIEPDSLTEPTRDTPLDVTLRGTQGNSDLPTGKVTFVDGEQASPEFWDAVNFAGLGEMTPPTGADRAQVDVLIDGEWVTGTPAAVGQAEVPVAEDDFEQITGLRVTFTRDGEELLSSSEKWSAEVPFSVTLRETYRSNSEQIEMTGSLENTVAVTSTRSDDEEVDSSSSATVVLDPGSHKIDVVKNPQGGSHFGEVGDTETWTLEFTNSGSGYLTVESLVDDVPSELRYNGEEITFATSEGGTLSTDVDVEQDDQKLTFVWPEDGRQMLPGETFTIKIPLENTRELLTADRAVNPMVVSVAETLEDCTNSSGNGQGLLDGLEDNQCGTSNYLQTVQTSNIFTVKGVKGSLEGAFVPSQDDAECTRLVEPETGEPYYGTDCAANSEIGGVDQWILHNLNTGVTPVKELQIFDQLPISDDRLLVTPDVSRASDYKPVIDPQTIELELPAGEHDVTLEFSTSDNVCMNTWTQLRDSDATVCESAGESWVPEDGVKDWAAVTGIRADITFAGQGLAPGEEANIRFSTTNVPNEGGNGGASVSVPAADQFAWNQFGIRYQYAGESQWRRLANGPVGVHLRTEDLVINKDVQGEAADAFAPEEFTAEVACTIDGVDVDMGEYETVTISGGSPTTISGIPGGAECTVTETGEVGEFGETSRDGSPTTVILDGDQEEVTLTNVYDYAGLNVTKNIAPEVEEVAGNPVNYGPFDFELACTAPGGQEIDLGSAAEFTLDAGETFTAPGNTIPSGSECVLTETNTGGAENVVFSGDNVTAGDENSATILVSGETDVEATVTNEFGASVFEIAKEVTGPGTEYSSGEFTFETTCEYNGEVLFSADEQTLGAGENYTYGPLPLGTECSTTEIGTGNATSTTVTVDEEDPEEGTSATATAGENSQLTFINNFELTSIEVAKVFGGPAGGFAGDVELELSCTWDGDGTVRVVDVLDPVRTLSADAPTTVFDGLPIGAECTVTETDDAGAAGTVITVGDDSTDGASAEVSTEVEQVGVRVENTYEFGALTVGKRVETDASAGVFGPFDYELSCTTLAGDSVLWGDSPALEFTLSDGETFTAPAETIPQNSTCVVRETENGGAEHVSIVGDDVTETGDGVASVFVRDSAEIEFVNGFDTGVFTVAKEIDGPGTDFQTGSFEFDVVCEYNGGEVLNETFTLEAGSSKTFGPFATGTTCEATETADGGATTTQVLPEGPVEMTDAGADTTFINTFELTSIEVEKVFGGPAGGFAGEVEVELSCTWDGDGTERDVEVFDPVRTLSPDSPAAVFDDLPIGADCTVTEVDSGGAAGTVITVGEEITEGITAEVSTEVEQVGVRVENTYEFGALTVGKRVETDASAGVFGPFDYELSCTTLAGDSVLWGDSPALEFTLSDGETFTAPAETIPQNSTCVVRETDNGGAEHVSIVGDDVTETGDGVASVFVRDSAEIEFVNGFDTGVFTVAKETEGPGALFATGPFEFGAVCEYNGETVLEETFALEAGATRTFGTFPKGTTCKATETDDGGADEVTTVPADGAITIGEDDTVTVTNFFEAKPDLPVAGANITRLAAIAGIILLAGGAVIVVRRRNS